MSYKIESSSRFDRDIKRVAKKYKSIKADLANLIESLEAKPTQGTPLGKSC